jgi:hypothetical protein
VVVDDAAALLDDGLHDGLRDGFQGGLHDDDELVAPSVGSPSPSSSLLVGAVVVVGAGAVLVGSGVPASTCCCSVVGAAEVVAEGSSVDRSVVWLRGARWVVGR